ncbi:PAS domain-containing sensor histidine kinase [Candidatus Thorarchaeota archaeon]|nr:MAG: PAS domain-containing sensor histidine kinase [Candidatus Thorarchaeota archaeon]
MSSEDTKPAKAEKARSETKSSGKYRVLFDMLADAVFIHEPDGTFLEVNEEACERLGYSRCELLQMSPADIDAPEYSVIVPERVAELKECGEIFFETVHVSKDGTRIPTELSSKIIEYMGQPAVLSIARDISERRKAQRQSDQKQRELELYLSLLRHDLSNDLQVISGSLEAIEMMAKNLDDVPRRMLESAEMAAHRMAALLRAFSSLDEVDEDRLLEIVTAVVQRAEQVHKNISISIETVYSPESIRVYNSRLLPMVFENLLRNAAEFAGKKPKITLEIGRTDNKATIVYRDNGPGISDELEAHLFERGVSSTGGGLGLYLSRQIVLAQGGSMKHLRDEKGTVFRIELPLANDGPTWIRDVS